MKIKPIVYENLTVQERVIASLEAVARDDLAERQRLVKTCPRRTYTMPDCDYSDKMEILYLATVCYEADLSRLALDFFTHMWLIDHLDYEDNIELSAQMAKTPSYIARMLGLQQAWHETMEKQGIDPALLSKAFGDLRHFSVDILMGSAKHTDTKPDQNTAKAYREMLEGHF